MHLRRALLLFALVLGMAALVTAVTGPPERDGEPQNTPPVSRDMSPRARPAPPQTGVLQVRFDTDRRAATRRLRTGRAALVTVEVDTPGQVELVGLATTQPADPVTPARFDVLAVKPGRYPVRFTPVAADEARVVGMLQVVRAQAATSSRSRSDDSNDAAESGSSSPTER